MEFHGISCKLGALAYDVRQKRKRLLHLKQEQIAFRRERHPI